MKKYIVLLLFNEMLDSGNTHPCGVCLCSTMNRYVGIYPVSNLLESEDVAVEFAKRSIQEIKEQIISNGVNEGWEIIDYDWTIAAVKWDAERKEVEDKVWLCQYDMIIIDTPDKKPRRKKTKDAEHEKVD